MTKVVLGALLRSFGGGIPALLRRRFYDVLREEDFEDVLSMGLFRLWNARHRYDIAQASLRVWLYRICENAALAVSRTGGLSVQINPDEDVAWRVFEVFSKLHSPRLVNVKVAIRKPKAESGETQEPKSEVTNLKSEMPDPQFLLFSNTICQGEEIGPVCRVADGESPPIEITVTATLNGQPWSQTIAIENVKDDASYLPRHWAKLEIDRLLAENATENREAIVALSKSMYVMSPFTSLLVLENVEMYNQFNVDRGRKDQRAMYACPEQIEVVVENRDTIDSTDSTIDGEIATTGSNESDVASTIVRIPQLSWPMPSLNDNGVEELSRHPMYWSRFRPLGFQKNNLWLEQNSASDFVTPPYLNCFTYQGGWNLNPIQNEWESKDLFESAYSNGPVAEYGQYVPAIPELRAVDFENLQRLPRFSTSPGITSNGK